MTKEKFKKYKVILHQEYIVEAEAEQAAIDMAERLGLGNEYEIGLATTVQEIEEVKESNEPVKTIHIEVDNTFDPGYYIESNHVYIEYEETISYINEVNDKYLVSGYESEIDNFLEEAKHHILYIEKD